jgi:hypothetical protein
MPWECIGDVDAESSNGGDEWITFARHMALKYIEVACGKPPDECMLAIMDNDHDLGSYSSIGVSYDYSYPQDYLSKAEETLDVFNSSVDWYKLRLHYEKIAFRECECEEEEEY